MTDAQIPLISAQMSVTNSNIEIGILDLSSPVSNVANVNNQSQEFALGCDSFIDDSSCVYLGSKKRSMHVLFHVLHGY